eukprot:8009338-Pyramimonas_sp.AAC.1
MQAGLRISFPAIILLLEVGMYASPRSLKKGQMISEELYITRSIVAGSGHGVPVATAMLHQLLGETPRLSCCRPLAFHR